MLDKDFVVDIFRPEVWRMEKQYKKKKTEDILKTHLFWLYQFEFHASARPSNEVGIGGII